MAEQRLSDALWRKGLDTLGDQAATLESQAEQQREARERAERGRAGAADRAHAQIAAEVEKSRQLQARAERAERELERLQVVERQCLEQHGNTQPDGWNEPRPRYLLERDLADAVEALREYGDHKDDCTPLPTGACTCGLLALLDRLEGS